MLKTALKPRWIAALVLALAVSGVFVLLSQWQFSRSQQTAPAEPAAVETAKPLTQVLTPGEGFRGSAADQIVTARGHFDASRQVLVKDRLQAGRTGYWVVTAFIVDGAPVLRGAAATPVTAIPVARGWVEQPSSPAAPQGTLTLTGRLIPSEAPVAAQDLPAGQVSALSVAELTNVWNLTLYPGFVTSFSEKAGTGEVGAAAGGPLQPITVSAQPQETTVNWLNIFYAVEWVVFAGFAVFLWWRLVADDYRRSLEEDEEDDDGAYATTNERGNA
ncbi:SURF1 family protein [Paenarthrobacter sp. DKR-5]|uniref:SURF1 family protein n=1 Tax=Paenarthrobacter sp. DKR-5 TaxID=2835535 RepID=UPI001BDC63E0|nr:SURF1 family protein [Paenarthrobacter sp. DKR-5]MBT1001009.1 SURF1 family protein [Paenarthrobacter sp. DKR-5]